MDKQQTQDIIEMPSERIIGRIFLIRGRKVMVDRDLAALYGVKTMVLNQAVKRNINRFPSDFMFQLNKEEASYLKSQIVISRFNSKKPNNSKSQIVTSSWGGTRKSPLVFTEHGIAMLSGVLNSSKAIQVNIQIIRTFIKLRMLIVDNKNLWEKIEILEKKYDKEISDIFDVLRTLLIQQDVPKEEIGFKTEN
ncbi:MAG: ORF6N domain-containing protein [Patescibacteria group bacterium]|jgi:hypothetical protein